MSEELATPVNAKAAKRAVATVADAGTEPALAAAEVLEETPYVMAPEPETPADVTAETAEAAMETVAETVETVAPPMAEMATEAMPEPAAASVFKVFELATANPALFELAARNVLAFAEVGAALTKGAQETSRTWLEAARTGAALQREGAKQIALARDVMSLIEAYSDLTRRNMETFAGCAQTMTRMSLQTAETAGKVLRAAA